MKTQDKFEERVDDILYEIINVFENHQQSCDDVHCGILQISLKEILGKAIREARGETAEDICAIIDRIEERDENTSMEQWKHYKGIRNAIRDKYVRSLTNRE